VVQVPKFDIEAPIPIHHGKTPTPAALVAYSQGEAFKVSTEPTRVHGTILWNVASMQDGQSCHPRQGPFPACAKLSRRGNMVVHWDDEI
jgi:hypothetical protein